MTGCETRSRCGSRCCHGNGRCPVRAAGGSAGPGGRVLSTAGDPAVLRPDGERAADGTGRHNCWTIAEAAGHRGPHRLQHLLSRAVWDEELVLDIAADWAVGHLDDGDAVLIVDETADEKSSAGAAGAARQYSGLEVTSDDTPEGHSGGHSVLLARRHRYTGKLSFYR